MGREIDHSVNESTWSFQQHLLERARWVKCEDFSDSISKKVIVVLLDFAKVLRNNDDSEGDIRRRSVERVLEACTKGGCCALKGADIQRFLNQSNFHRSGPRNPMFASYGVTNQPLPKAIFESILKSVLNLSGYFGPATIHAIRSAALVMALRYDHEGYPRTAKSFNHHPRKIQELLTVFSNASDLISLFAGI